VLAILLFLAEAARARVPLKKGIPAAAFFSETGRPLHATRAGELADARRMGENGIYEFFAGVVRQHLGRP
jgi:hypothetical protein